VGVESGCKKGSNGRVTTVTAGSHAGADPLSSADATACAAAGKEQKGNHWSPEEHIAVMEAYAIVAGDPTTGASQSVADFAARMERRFLANRRCLKKEDFEKMVGTAAKT
jgi:hypothetical protein